FDAIRAAKSSINLEYYIFEDVVSGGTHLGDLLIEKHQAGVAVNILYDSYGSDQKPPDFFARLKQAGLNVVAFNPLNPVTFNFRDHRKLLVVDGARTIVGGINLSTTYQSSAGSSGPGGPQFWRDTDMEIVGPAAAQLQPLFLRHWEEQKGPALAHD